MADDAKDELVLRAASFQSSGDLDAAIAEYRRAIEVDGDRTAQIQYNLGTALGAAGDGEAAEAAYRRALELDPTHVHALDNLGAVLQGQGRLDEAEACYRGALDIDPDNAWAHAALGGLLFALGRYDASIPSLLAALAYQPDDAASLISLGMAQVYLRRWPGAERTFRRAIETQPDNALAHFNLAVALDGLGMFEEAVAWYHSGLALSPDNSDALRNLGATFCKLGRDAEALEVYTKALEVAPTDEVVIHLVAAMRGENPPSAPRGYVRRVFDDYADRYDEHMIGHLAYRVPAAIDALVQRAVSGRVATALDLGCGTGLVGAALRDRVDVLHGVDIAPKMIEVSAATGVYDELHEGEICDYLDGVPEPAFELITAADVVIYFGALEALFRSVRSRLADGGLFVFSVELLDTGDFRLGDQGRYAHSADYVARLAGDNDMTVSVAEDLTLRLQKGEPVAGRLYALARGD